VTATLDGSPARFNARHSEHGFAVFHGCGGFAAKADARLHFGSSSHELRE